VLLLALFRLDGGLLRSVGRGSGVRRRRCEGQSRHRIFKPFENRRPYLRISGLYAYWACLNVACSRWRSISSASR
jgi:hypothetical protein